MHFFLNEFRNFILIDTCLLPGNVVSYFVLPVWAWFPTIGSYRFIAHRNPPSIPYRYVSASLSSAYSHHLPPFVPSFFPIWLSSMLLTHACTVFLLLSSFSILFLHTHTTLLQPFIITFLRSNSSLF